MHISVEAELDDGRRVKSVCRGPKGIWGRPLEPGDHEAKLEDCLSRALPAERAAQLIALLDDLENQPTVEPIVRLIAGNERNS
jgi:hypothetical protein